MYLAPYSPELNPIEEGFSAVKAWVCRHNTAVREAFEAPDKQRAIVMLMLAITTAMSPKLYVVGTWFRDCEYV